MRADVGCQNERGESVRERLSEREFEKVRMLLLLDTTETSVTRLGFLPIALSVEKLSSKCSRNIWQRIGQL